jgi:antitoxin Phd
MTPLTRKTRSLHPSSPKAAQRAGAAIWKLEDAKAKFSEVVRRARDQGPQYVTVRGKPAVAVVDIAELQRLSPPPAAAVPLVDFLEGLQLDGLDLTRDPDPGRDWTL